MPLLPSDTISTNPAQPSSVLLVFHLSTLCNLECSYCNVEAGPRGERPVLDPHTFEKWLEAFSSVCPRDISIKLHGGAPLIVDPPVELFAAIARNTLARYPRTKLADVAIQSNGIGLDDWRLASLARLGMKVNISIDGPAAIHDRQRQTAGGRGSHKDAIRAHHRLRANGRNTAVIAVVTDPHDVVPSLQFFLEDGFREARMNPMRPDGRAAAIRAWDDTRFMRDMALEYLQAAKLIAAHNEACPAEPFIEDNLARLMESLIVEGSRPTRLDWTFLIDSGGNLWAHPGGYGIDSLRLTRDEIPSTDSLRRALTLDTFEGSSMAGLFTGIERLSSRLFTACTECQSPDYCIPVYGPMKNTGMARPICTWRTELTNHLQAWLREAPAAARRIVRPEQAANSN